MHGSGVQVIIALSLVGYGCMGLIVVISEAIPEYCEDGGSSEQSAVLSSKNLRCELCLVGDSSTLLCCSGSASIVMSVSPGVSTGSSGPSTSASVGAVFIGLGLPVRS